MTRPTVVLRCQGDLATLVIRARGGAPRRAALPRAPEMAWPQFWIASLDLLTPQERRGARLLVVLDGPRCRLRRLFDVPTETETGAATMLLRRDPSAFFIGPAESMLTSDAVRRADGWWGAVVDRETHEHLVAACTASGVSLHGVLPEMAMESLDPDADAEAQLLAARTDAPLLIDPSREVRGSQIAGRRRLTLLAALAVMIGAASFGPQTVLRMRTAALSERAAALGAPGSAGGQLADQQARAVLDEVDAMRGDREATSVLLSRIAAALPSAAVIRSVELDTLLVTVTIVAPLRVDVVSALSQLAGLEGPRIRGALAREWVDGAEQQRTTLEFDRDPRRLGRSIRPAKR